VIKQFLTDFFVIKQLLTRPGRIAVSLTHAR